MTLRREPPKHKVVKKFDGDNTPVDFDFPTIGIQEIDKAVFDLFDKEINMEAYSDGTLKKVDVIFSTGERFALTRRKNPIRDKNNANILPLISIMRQNFDIGADQNGKKTAIAFRTLPNYTIKYRLSEKDRAYQNIVNKQNLSNQDNVAAKNHLVDESLQLNAKPGTVASRRRRSKIQFAGGASIDLKNDTNENIYEIIQTPYPYFISTTYDIVLWAQYMEQGADMIEFLLNQITVPGGEFPIKTDAGFELVAFIGNDINFENNFDGMTDTERVIKYSFTLTVPGYIINSKVPGLPNRTRSFYSAPTIDFTYKDTSNRVTADYQPETDKEKVERHVLTDITSIDEEKVRKGETNATVERFVKNPFTANEKVEFLRIKNKNTRIGESVISSRVIKEIERQHE